MKYLLILFLLPVSIYSQVPEWRRDSTGRTGLILKCSIQDIRPSDIKYSFRKIDSGFKFQCGYDIYGDGRIGIRGDTMCLIKALHQYYREIDSLRSEAYKTVKSRFDSIKPKFKQQPYFIDPNFITYFDEDWISDFKPKGSAVTQAVFKYQCIHYEVSATNNRLMIVAVKGNKRDTLFLPKKSYK